MNASQPTQPPPGGIGLPDASETPASETPASETPASETPLAPLRAGDAADPLGRAVIAAMSEGVVVSLRASGTVITNAAAERILGLSGSQLRFGESPPPGWALLDGDGITPLTEHPATQVMRTGVPVKDRLGAVRRGDGSLVWTTMSVQPLPAADGSPDGVVMTFTDVTERLELTRHQMDDARLRSLDERLNEIEIIVTTDGAIVHGNDRALSEYGYTRTAFEGLTIRDLRDPSTMTAVAPQMAQADKTGTRFETIHRRRDGSAFPVEVSSRGFTVNGQRYLHSLVRNLTESRRAEAERLDLVGQVEAALRDRDLILAGSPVGIIKVRNRRLLWVNRRMEELFGYTTDEMIDTSTLRLYADEADWARFGAEAYPVLAAGGSFATDHWLRRKDGTSFLARMSARVSEPADAAGESIWTIEDVTQTREAEARLAESEERLRSIIAAMAEGVILIDALGAFITCNGAAERILGLSRQQLDGSAPFDPAWRTIHEDGRSLPRDQRPALETLRTGVGQRGVVLGIRVPGDAVRWVTVSSEPIRRAGEPQPVAVVETLTDITDLRHGQQALEASERRYRKLFDGLPGAIVVAEVMRDPDGTVIDWRLREANPAARPLFGAGYPFAVGRPMIELFGEAAMQPLLARTQAILENTPCPRSVSLTASGMTFTGNLVAIDERTIVAVADNEVRPCS